jgi:hypothetical protein
MRHKGASSTRVNVAQIRPIEGRGRAACLQMTLLFQRALGVVTALNGKATRRGGEAPNCFRASMHAVRKEPFHVGWQLSRKHLHAAKLRPARACSPVSVADGDVRQKPHA